MPRFFQRLRTRFGFAQEDLPDRPASDEIATRGAISGAGLAQTMNWLPNPDRILRKTGRHVQHLRELLYDDEVFAAVQYLSSALREFEWELIGAEDEPGERIETVTAWLQALDWDRLTGEILCGRLFGYQPLEVIWAEEAGLWRPADVIGKPPEWFAFTKENELALRPHRFGREELQDLPPGKFLLARNKPSYQNPYGEAVLSRCFWPVTFKKGGLRYWITFAEKYGMPFAVGKHPRGESDEKIDKLLDMLEAMVRDAVAAVPDDSSVELVEAAGKGSSGAVYQELVAYCERSINKVILSNELTTTNPDTGGTYAATESQITNVSGAVIGDGRRLIEQTMSELLRWVWHFNFGDAAEAPRLRLFQEEEVGKERAERDEILTRTGVRFTAEYFQREYQLSEEDFELRQGDPLRVATGRPAPRGDGLPQNGSRPRFAQSPGLPFAQSEAGQAEIDALLEATASEAAGDAEGDQALMEALLQAPIRLIQEGGQPEAVMEALARAYPQLDSSALEERLRSLLFIAQLYGRLEEDPDNA